MKNNCHFLIMAAGTGGHVFPALAVARELLDSGFSVTWLGSKAGMEHRVLTAENIAVRVIDMRGFRGKRLLAKLLMPWLLIKSIVLSIREIRQLKIDVVIGFGGYISVPGGIAAKLCGKKLIIHEQNSVPGTANRLLAKIADQVLVAFPNTLAREQWIGNPIRNTIRVLHKANKQVNNKQINNKPPAKKSKKVLILGGSLGAQVLNTMVPQLINSLPVAQRPAVWHQTGEGNKPAVVASYPKDMAQLQIDEFIGDMALAYKWADVIICRAGALTVSEIAVVGLPAIFIPYPHAIDDHQRVNAQRLVDADAALLIPQSELTVSLLKKTLEPLLDDDERLMMYAENVKKLAMPNATQKFVAICQHSCEVVNHAG
ncbi:MAG: undecaprenyldiphospho-muramoylpentapeptide beta-N-acetylglucosaminyltransferase [Cellvibrionaceae bacterium]|nr:undecaprenyldiphospho-muramoylpentapeptide beta-N-acetylglucosaminyltransferase [Cellvibrionaceae bacterium]